MYTYSDRKSYRNTSSNLSSNCSKRYRQEHNNDNKFYRSYKKFKSGNQFNNLAIMKHNFGENYNMTFDIKPIPNKYQSEQYSTCSCIPVKSYFTEEFMQKMLNPPSTVEYDMNKINSSLTLRNNDQNNPINNRMYSSVLRTGDRFKRSEYNSLETAFIFPNPVSHYKLDNEHLNYNDQNTRIPEMVNKTNPNFGLQQTTDSQMRHNDNNQLFPNYRPVLTSFRTQPIDTKLHMDCYNANKELATTRTTAANLLVYSGQYENGCKRCGKLLEKKYQCHRCSENFNKKEDIIQHLNNHIEEMQKLINELIIKRENP